MKKKLMFLLVCLPFFIFGQGNSIWSLYWPKIKKENLQYEYVITKLDCDSVYKVVYSSDFVKYKDIKIGDIDNDGADELVFVANQKILIYEEDSDTAIVCSGPATSDMTTLHIADVTGDNQNEVIIYYNVSGQNNISVYRYIDGEVQRIWHTKTTLSFDISIGDVDNDGLNEIVNGISDSIRVYCYDDQQSTFFKKYSIPSRHMNDMAMVADVDNDGQNEIISGGNYSSARIWKHESGQFNLIGEQAVDGFSQGVNAGDIDGDGMNELIVGTAQQGGAGNLYIYTFISGSFNLQYQCDLSRGVEIPGITLGDCDNDSIDEIIVWESGIFDYNQTSGQYELKYSGMIKKAVVGDFHPDWECEPRLFLYDEKFNYSVYPYQIILKMLNTGCPVQNPVISLSSLDSAIQIDNPTLSFPPLEFDEIISNENDPFRFQIVSEPDSSVLPFKITLSENDSVLYETEFTIESPRNQFINITDDVGFVKPPMGSPTDIFFTDVNNDGYADIYTSCFYPNNDDMRQIYWGTSEGIFLRDTVSGPIDRNTNFNCYTDINNDHMVDIFESSWDYYGELPYSLNCLLMYSPPHFVDISSSSNIDDRRMGQGTCSFDYNNDGYLDIFVTNGVENEQRDRLYRNNGDLTYTNVADSVGISEIKNGQNVVVGDINNDGLMDIFVTNYDAPHSLWLASRDDNNITYQNISETAGINLGNEITVADFGDFNNDGRLDIVAYGKMTVIYINNQDNTFSEYLISTTSDNSSYWSDIVLLDYNHDGYLDILTSQYDVPYKIFENCDDLNFIDVSRETGVDIYSGIGTIGAADFNRDGQIDIASPARYFSDEYQFLVNQGTTNNWLEIKLEGVRSNSLAIGARIDLWSSLGYQMREINGNLGNDLTANFGLAEATIVDSIHITWPSGIEQSLYNLNPNHIINVVEETANFIGNNSENTYPQTFYFFQNYPNPFNPTTTIRYNIPKTSNVTLTIYNMNGQIVDRLVNQKQEPGFYSIHWDARNVSTGVYFYQIKADGFQQVKKMLLIK